MKIPACGVGHFRVRRLQSPHAAFLTFVKEMPANCLQNKSLWAVNQGRYLLSIQQKKTQPIIVSKRTTRLWAMSVAKTTRSERRARTL